MNTNISLSVEHVKHWLMRTNTAQVFAFSLAALLLVSGWWTWCLSRELESPLSSLPDAMKQKKYAQIGVIETLDASDGDMIFPVANPFGGRPEAAPAANLHVKSTNAPTAIVKPTNQTTPPARQPETLSLVYKGIFIRSDGKRLALIQNSKSGTSSFYQEGQALFGMKIGGIEKEKVDVKASDGSTTTLTIRKSHVFTGGL
jgi:hypothetical protein